MAPEPRGLTGLFMEAEEAADLPGRRVALGMGCPLRCLETVESCGGRPRCVCASELRSGLGLCFFLVATERGVTPCVNQGANHVLIR
jgi:hypothetical protein